MKIDYTLDIADELFEALADVARKTDRDLSQVIRVALRNYLASREPLETNA